jgi:NAD-dependent deacetylase
VVWFGESLDGEVLEAALRASAAADLCLVVGTSAVVHPAASLPLATRRGGGRLVEVNPEPTPLSGLCDVALQGPAGVLVPALIGLD